MRSLVRHLWVSLFFIGSFFGCLSTSDHNLAKATGGTIEAPPPSGSPAAKDSCPAAKLPNPAIMFFGFSDLYVEKYPERWDKYWSKMTIIEGTTRNPKFLQSLKEKNILFAHRMYLDSTRPFTTEDLVKQWSAPFNDTLEGALPCGFDAISIDEMHTGYVDGAPETATIAEALRILRERYPHKLVLIAGVCWIASAKPKLPRFKRGSYQELLTAIHRYADLYVQEWYLHMNLRESSRQENFSVFSRALATLGKDYAPILEKTIIAVGVAENRKDQLNPNNDPEFKDFVREQVRAVAHESQALALAKLVKGVSFWILYRATDETIMAALDEATLQFQRNQ